MAKGISHDHRQDESGDTSSHQDPADDLNIDSDHFEVQCKGEDRPKCDQEDAETDTHDVTPKCIEAVSSAVNLGLGLCPLVCGTTFIERRLCSTVN